MPVLNEYLIIGGAFLLPPQEDDVNLPHDKIPGKTREKSEPNKHGDPNSLKMAVFIENYISGHTFILIPQEDGSNENICLAFIILPKEYVHKLWIHIVTMIDGHGKKWHKIQVISSS